MLAGLWAHERSGLAGSYLSTASQPESAPVPSPGLRLRAAAHSATSCGLVPKVNPNRWWGYHVVMTMRSNAVAPGRRIARAVDSADDVATRAEGRCPENHVIKAATWSVLAVCTVALAAFASWTRGEALAGDARLAQATGAPGTVERGRALFNDPTLSEGGLYSCASCHPNGGHTDNKTYVGVEVVEDGDPRGRNTPTLWGVGSRSAYSWAGTAPSLSANIRSIIVNRMKGPEPSPETLEALVTYVSSLGYPPNPNLTAEGTPSASAPDAAKRGYKVFVRAGCQACHLPPTYDKKEVEDVLSGGKFKVPSLRVVSLTAPYFHDGRFATLDASVAYMWAYVQRTGSTEKLTEDDLRDLVAFLRIL
jgi:cytochrome c peroxidase